MQTIEEYKELYKAKLKARRDARAELVREEEYLRKLYAYERKKEEQATYEEERKARSDKYKATGAANLAKKLAALESDGELAKILDGEIITTGEANE